VARTARKLGIHRNTVSFWIKRRDLKGRIHRMKPGGRRRVLNNKACRLAEKLLLSEKFGTLRDTAAELYRRLGIKLSTKTLSLRLKQYSKGKGKQIKHVTGKPKKQLSGLNKAKRLEFCKKNLKRNWSNVMFTDRCKLQHVFPGVSARSCGWIKKGSSWEAPKVDHPSVYNVYGGITRFGTTTLKEVTGSTNYHTEFENKQHQKARNITSGEYYGVVAKHFLPQGTKIFASGPGMSSWTLQQDNDPTHKTPSHAAIEEWVHYHPGQPVTLLKGWPPHSPDLSPIENVWGIIQQKVNKAGCKTFQEFKAKVDELYNHLSPETIKRLFDSMKARMQECIKNKGGKTNY